MKRLLISTSFLLQFLISFGQDYFLVTGTYTNGDSKGIYLLKFNGKTGSIAPVSITEGVENPSYLAISANGKFVYAANENGGDKPGAVSSFAFDRTKGTLKFLNKQETSGDHPCYVATDKSGKWVFAANYTGGSLSAFPINPDGSVGALAQLIKHEGKGADPRQTKPHVHSTIFSPDQQYLLTSDLGIDKVMLYRFNASAKQPLSLGADSFFTLKPGSGPRHLSFHPSKPYVYVLGELAGTVTAYSYKGSKYTQIQNISSHPAGYAGTMGSADIHVTPDGRFLYASNRGDANSLAIFSIDTKTGKLILKGFQPTEGIHPRNFTIDPTGRFLLVANRDSNNIVVFSMDQQTGSLKQVGKPYLIPNPVFLGLLK